MNITGLSIDGFGVWNGLSLQGLDDGLNVLYGPNEAGKTTLLQFVRSALYGFSPARQKYLPPKRGGRPGGSIGIAGPHGRFQLARYDRTDPDATHPHVMLTAADGTRQGEHLVKSLLADVDEPTFNNVFAVGLREIQELGTLSDTEAAESLYGLSVGLDRVSLVEVMRELQTSRNRVLDAEGGPCQVLELLERRQALRAEIEELGKVTHRYGRLAAQRDQLQGEISRLEEKNRSAERQARVAEVAITVRDRWHRRAELDAQLAALDPAGPIPEDAVERIDGLNAQLQKHQQFTEQCRGRCKEIRREAAALAINEPLRRQAARIEAIAEQQPWITTLRKRIGELEGETAGLRKELNEEQKQLGLGDRSQTDALPNVSSRSLAVLRTPARDLKCCRAQLAEAQQQVDDAGQSDRSLAGKIESALAARGQSDLADAIEQAGELMSQLRRRVQLDEQIDQMTRSQQDLEEQSLELVDRELLPTGLLFALGGLFVLGGMLALAGLFLPQSIIGSAGQWMAGLGLGGLAAAGFGKIMLERSNARRLDSCQRQIDMLQKQIGRARQERTTLDEALPKSDLPLAERMQMAEHDLTALEELVPLDTRLGAAREQAEASGARLRRAESELEAARRGWRLSLRSVGLPERLAPKQVRRLLQRCEQIGRIQRRLGHRNEELAHRRDELESLLGRVRQLADETGTAVGNDDPIAQIRQLAEAVARQEERLEHHDTLRREYRRLRRRGAKHRQAAARAKHRRREVLFEVGVRDEAEFRRRAEQAAQAGGLRRDREAVAREIAAALGSQCTEEDVAAQLEQDSQRRLESVRDELLERLGTFEKQLHERLEKRGQLAEQLKALADDRQLAAKMLDLGVVQKQLDEAVRRWQVLAVTCQVVESIRESYERDRQPETLLEASGYLDRLTKGRYRRVWTPLGQDVLRVDDAEGNALSPEVLSRGTREQLFLALRLALAAAFGRRGAKLPLILDDVLVNFDAERAKAAVGVLRDFAAEGHQVLVFTCHDHLQKTFKSLKVPVSHLPDNTEAGASPVTFEPASKPKSKRKRSKKADPPPQPPVEIEPAVEEPVAEEIPAIEEAEVAVEAEVLPVEEADPALFEPEGEDVEDVPWAEEEEDLEEPEDEYEEDEYEEVHDEADDEAEDDEDYEEAEYEEEDYEEDEPEADAEEEYEEEDEYEWEEASYDDEYEDDDPAAAA